MDSKIRDNLQEASSIVGYDSIIARRRKSIMPDWNAELYLKFQNERTQPAIDLARRIGLTEPHKILDIGCGPGNSTRVLQRQFQNARILGVDNSPGMIAQAKRDYPDMEFELCDASRDLHQLDHDYDIVFSNACIQWLPDHKKLLSEMLQLLAPGGILAVQTPMNYDEPIHLIIERVTASERWSSFFPNRRIFFNLLPEEYFDILSETAAEFSLWKTIYYHHLGSHQDILTWYRSTGLKPYLDQLPDAIRPEFEQVIFNEIEASYPAQANGQIIFRFPRFFFTAVAKG
jgi:trans-aconitate 2-methyltransferase